MIGVSGPLGHRRTAARGTRVGGVCSAAGGRRSAAVAAKGAICGERRPAQGARSVWWENVHVLVQVCAPSVHTHRQYPGAMDHMVVGDALRQATFLVPGESLFGVRGGVCLCVRIHTQDGLSWSV